MGISLKELNPHGYDLTEEQAANQQKLFVAINKVRDAWGKPMIVTSGVRSEADQQRINPKAPKSKHLIGAAVDLQDKDGSLGKWAVANVPLLESAGLWCEDVGSTKGWVHWQVLPPKSGKRFFLP